MAPTRPDAQSTSSVKPCKRCSNIVVKSGLKCIKCDTVSHVSCVSHLKNAKIISDSSIICCEEPISTEEIEADTSFASANGEDITRDTEVSDVAYLKEIITCKELLIRNQSELITSLKEQIVLLKRINSTPEIDSADGIPAKRLDKWDNKNKHGPVLQDKKLANKNSVRGESKNATNKVENNKTSDKPLTRSKTKENVLEVPPKRSNPKHSDEDNKKHPNITEKTTEAKRANPVKLVTGRKRDCGLSAIPKKAYLLVRRLVSTTTEEDLKNYLVTDFPEVEVEQLKNDFDSSHSRFKVTVNLENREKVDDPEYWPEGVVISRFFHPRRQMVQKR